MAGVKDSAVFVLFLTDGTTERFYVQLEIREAFRLQKPILMIEETDDRFGKPNYAKESKLVPHMDQVTGSPVLDEKQLAWLFSEVTAIPVRRQAHELGGFLDEVERQTLLAIGGAGKRPPAELCNATPSAAAAEPEPGLGPEPEPEPEAVTGPSEGVPPASSETAPFLSLLRQLDVLEYASVLAEEDIRSEDDLRDLSMDELKGLGFKLGSRKRVVKWATG